MNDNDRKNQLASMGRLIGESLRQFSFAEREEIREIARKVLGEHRWVPDVIWGKVPWRYRWIVIPFREIVWYPLREFLWTWRCDFLRWHRWRPGGIVSAHHGIADVCDRCGEMRWERDDG